MSWLLTTLLLAAPAEGEQLVLDTQAWHEQRKARLTSEEGWLSLVGLFWVESTHTAGATHDNDFVFPAHVPARLGTFSRAGSAVTFQPAAGVEVLKEGKVFTGGALAADDQGRPDVLQVGSVRFHVIRRGEKLGLRVKDANAPARKDFTDIERFPVSPRWVVQARFQPRPQPRSLPVPTVLGTIEPMSSPGVLEFSLDGKPYQLTPVREEGANELFLIFADHTNRRESYGAGRFLYAPLPKDGMVTLDFNRAYNPPCAFTPFATCPLPPKENRLKVRVDAGEKRYTKH